jgi:hypothetical protein
VATTSEILTMIAPEVAARADADVWISLAVLQMAPSVWGTVYQMAVCYLAAHMATLAPLDVDDAADAAGVAGPVTARSTGELSESYGATTAVSTGSRTAEEADLSTTVYGRRYLALRATRAGVGPRVVIVAR